jgi:hypothetical protein
MISKLKFTDIKVRNILVQHLIIIGFGILIFWLERLEIANLFWEKMIVLVMALVKCVYFIEHSFRKIEEASLNNISYNRFLAIILTNILLIIVSFAIDYTCLEQIDPGSFKGIAVSEGIFESAFDFLYLSVVSFTTVAYGDIIPLTKAARSLTIMEVGVAYLTTIIIISNFVQIKESIEKEK